MLANQSKAKVCPKHLSPKESSVSLQTFVHIWRYETKNNFLQIRVREDMQKNCQSSSWKFSFSTPRQDQKLWKCIAIVVGSWAFLLPSFSTTLRPLIISPNLQFNTFRPFSLPLQPDPNLCLSICTGRKKPASFIERDPPLQFACPPEKFVWRSPFAESFLASPNENVKDSAMLKAERWFLSSFRFSEKRKKLVLLMCVI